MREPPARGRQKSRSGRGYAPIAPRAFADPRASVGVLGAGAGQLSCTGSGTAKVASRARIRLNCSASVRRSPSLRRGFGGGFGSTQLHRLGDGKSGVAGEDTPELLRQRSPTPEPGCFCWVGERRVSMPHEGEVLFSGLLTSGKGGRRFCGSAAKAIASFWRLSDLQDGIPSSLGTSFRACRHGCRWLPPIGPVAV